MGAGVCPVNSELRKAIKAYREVSKAHLTKPSLSFFLSLTSGLLDFLSWRLVSYSTAVRMFFIRFLFGHADVLFSPADDGLSENGSDVLITAILPRRVGQRFSELTEAIQ